MELLEDAATAIRAIGGRPAQMIEAATQYRNTGHMPGIDPEHADDLATIADAVQAMDSQGVPRSETARLLAEITPDAVTADSSDDG